MSSGGVSGVEFKFEHGIKQLRDMRRFILIFFPLMGKIKMGV